MPDRTDGSDFYRRFSSRHPPAEISACLENCRRLKALVVGEMIIDEYQYCEALGKSSKEPTLALRHLSTEKFAGGIAAVANHAAGFCDSVSLASMLGESSSQEDFIRGKLCESIRARFIEQKNAPTIVKRRLIENASFTKLMEVYEIQNPPGPEDQGKFCDLLLEMIPEHDLVIAVDYGHGLLSREAVMILCKKAKFLAVNTQCNAENHGFHTISRYSRADFICLTEKELRLECRDRHGDLREHIMDVADRLECSRVAVTRGRLGCICYGRGEGFSEIPAQGDAVVDRIGAGDAFLSLAALGAALEAPMEVAGFLGNAAGSIAVQTVGHRQSAHRRQLFQNILEVLRAHSGGDPSGLPETPAPEATRLPAIEAPVPVHG